MRRLWLVFLPIGVVLFSAAACDDGGSGGSGGSSTTTTTTTMSAGGGGTGGTPGTGGTGGIGGTAGAGGTGGAAPAGYCTKACDMPGDCCPPGFPGCPSTSYPTNWTCENNVCVSPQCAVKQDCVNEGLPQDECVLVNGLHQCVTPCVDDTQCPVNTNTTCIGVDDNMNKYCRVPPMPFVCTDDPSCGGFGICEDGACVCRAAGDCSMALGLTCAGL